MITYGLLMGLIQYVNVMLLSSQEDDWCEVIWLMDCTYNGMMLQKILDIALPLACTSYIECIRNLSAEMKKNGAF